MREDVSLQELEGCTKSMIKACYCNYEKTVARK